MLLLLTVFVELVFFVRVTTGLAPSPTENLWR